jgi:hypothetical protein
VGLSPEVTKTAAAIAATIDTVRLIEQGHPLCAQIFSWRGYPGLKENYRFDTRLGAWRRWWTKKK